LCIESIEGAERGKREKDGDSLRVVKGSVLAVVSGALLALCFPYPDLGLLAYFALVPLLIALFGSSPRDAALYGFLTGWVLFAALSYWVAIYGAFPFILIVSLAASLIAVFAALSSYVIKRTGPLLQLFFLPVVWVVIEFLRSELGSYSYPYGVLGYSQTGIRPVLQIAGILGVYGISYLIVFVNTGIAVLIKGRDLTERKSLYAVQICVVLMLLASAGFGFVRTASFKDKSKNEVSVGIVQPSVPQKLKWDEDMAPSIMNKYEGLVRPFRVDSVDMIVLPEATLPLYVEPDDPLLYRLKSWASMTKTPLLAGVPLIDEDLKSRNTVQLIYPGGRENGRYDKMYPAPFGEFVPFRPISERLWTDFTARGDVTPGKNPTVFRLRRSGSNKDLRFGVLICSESLYSHLARRVVRDGAEAIFVMTNDAWFYTTNESDLHFDMSVLRAVENGVYVAQAANSGVSGVVDPTGRVVEQTKVFEVTTLKSTIGFNDTRTFFNKAGYLFPYILSALLFLFLLFLIFSVGSADTVSEDGNEHTEGNRQWRKNAPDGISSGSSDKRQRRTRSNRR
jgi:apolipoprotein N-acyltransferase